MSCLSMADLTSKQIGGDHYVKHSVQPWTIIDEYKLNYYEGNALKYILRRKANRVEDLQKAIHYLEKEISNILPEKTQSNLIDLKGLE